MGSRSCGSGPGGRRFARDTGFPVHRCFELYPWGWVFRASGLGIREDGTLVTRDTSRFAPRQMVG